MKIVWRNCMNEIYGEREVRSEAHVTQEVIDFLITGDGGTMIKLDEGDTISIEE